jgi:hypothetical protein
MISGDYPLFSGMRAGSGKSGLSAGYNPGRGIFQSAGVPSRKIIPAVMVRAPNLTVFENVTVENYPANRQFPY